jgi:hypothetical protein
LWQIPVKKTSQQYCFLKNKTFSIENYRNSSSCKWGNGAILYGILKNEFYKG